MEILNTSREVQVIKKAQELLKNKAFEEELAKFFISLMEGSRRLQAEFILRSQKQQQML
jgi:chorismate mutase